ncbi:hypothetical protein BY458DRAFT_444416 [Sporodiniella umbellata]|nr:hypothetical protein BY458DRAFT_444416 [Sporodiniella umbellata]
MLSYLENNNGVYHTEQSKLYNSIVPPYYHSIYQQNMAVSPPLTPIMPFYYYPQPPIKKKKSSQQQHKHVCDYQQCQWSFKRFEHLKRHMLVHTGERPFACEHPGCTKTFGRSDNLRAHYRTHYNKKQRKPKRQHILATEPFTGEMI